MTIDQITAKQAKQNAIHEAAKEIRAALDKARTAYGESFDDDAVQEQIMEIVDEEIEEEEEDEEEEEEEQEEESDEE